MTMLLKVVSFTLDYKIFGMKILSTRLWLAMFIISVLIIKSGIYSRKMLIPVFIYTIVVLLMYSLDHLQNAAYTWFDAQVLPLVVSSILYELYIRMTSRESWVVMYATCTYIVVALILNIVGLYKYPIAVREIVSGVIDLNETSKYMKMGIDGYGFFSGLPPLVPVLVLLIRKNRKKYVRIISAIVLLLLILAIILSTITTPLVLALVGLFISYLIGSYFSRIQSLIATILLLIVVLVNGPVGLVRSVIPVLIEISPSKDVALRLRDVDYALEGNFEVSYTSSNLNSFEGRAQRVFWNTRTFLLHPIFGSSATNEYGAFHLFWLYMIASLGLVGAIPFLRYLYLNFKNTVNILPKEERYYYLLSIALFISMGLIKNVAGWFMYLGPLFIVPSILAWHVESNRVYE